MRDVLNAIQTWRGEGKRMALETVVMAEGSAPRRQTGTLQRGRHPGVGERWLCRNTTPRATAYTPVPPSINRAMEF